jgi:hypothetical protein
MEDGERRKFEGLMKSYAEYCGVVVLAWTVLSNHFHLLVEVPPCEPDAVSDEELLRRVRTVYHGARLRLFEEEFARAAALGGAAGAALREQARQRHLQRMGSLSEYVKMVKQCLSQWFNRQNNREGTMWEGRFRSAVVGGAGEEGTAAVLRVVAGYIDLNAVRAGLASEAGGYAWSSFGAAVGRDDAFSRRGLGRLLGKRARGENPASAEQLAEYQGNYLAAAPAGAADGPMSEAGGQTQGAHGGDRKVAGRLARRVAGLAKAMVIGDPGFVAELRREGREPAGLSAVLVVETAAGGATG